MLNTISYIDFKTISSIRVTPKMEYYVEVVKGNSVERNFFGRVTRPFSLAKFATWEFSTEDPQEMLSHLNRRHNLSLVYEDGKFYTPLMCVVVVNGCEKNQVFETIEEAIIFANRISEKTGLECLFADPLKANS